MFKEKIANKLKSQQIKNFIIYGFGQAINLISPLLVIPYIISVCGEEGLGKAGVGFSFALIAIVLVDYGSYINGTKEISINHLDNKKLEEQFNTIYFSKFILLIFVLLISTLIINYVPFFQRDKKQLFFSLLIVVGQFINPTWFFQGIQNFKWISTINVLSKVIYVGAIFVFIKKSEDYIYINFFLGLGLIISSFIGYLWICKKFGFSIKNASFDQSIVLIKSEFSLTLSQVFFSIYQYTPIMIVSYIGGDFMAGQYRIIDQVVMIFRTYFQMFFNFSYPDICLKIYKDNGKGVIYWLKCNILNYIFVLGILLLFFVFSSQILSFFKVNISENTQIIQLFNIGLLIPVFLGITFALKQLLFSFNQNKFYIITTIITTISCLIIMYFNVKTFGLIGTFLTIILIEIITIAVYLYILKPFLFTNKKIDNDFK